MTGFGRSEGGSGRSVVEESPCDSQAGGATVDAESGLPWLAAYTRPRHEEKVRQYCEERGIETFLPCRRIMKRWSDRRKEIHQPLFPSYVFLQLDEEHRRRAVQAPGFLWFVRTQNGPTKVDPWELWNLRVALANGLDCDPLPGARPGDPVEITAGPLRGCRGHLERKDAAAIVLLVTAINGTVRVRLPDGATLRSLSPSPARSVSTSARWARACG